MLVVQKGGGVIKDLTPNNFVFILIRILSVCLKFNFGFPPPLLLSFYFPPKFRRGGDLQFWIGHNQMQSAHLLSAIEES